jgi:hypothetical protein
MQGVGEFFGHWPNGDDTGPGRCMGRTVYPVRSDLVVEPEANLGPPVQDILLRKVSPCLRPIFSCSWPCQANQARRFEGGQWWLCAPPVLASFSTARPTGGRAPGLFLSLVASSLASSSSGSPLVGPCQMTKGLKPLRTLKLDHAQLPFLSFLISFSRLADDVI